MLLQWRVLCSRHPPAQNKSQQRCKNKRRVRSPCKEDLAVCRRQGCPQRVTLCLSFPTALPVVGQYRKESGAVPGSVGGSGSDGRRRESFPPPGWCGPGRRGELRASSCAPRLGCGQSHSCWRDIRLGQRGHRRRVKFPAQVASTVLPCSAVLGRSLPARGAPKPGTPEPPPAPAMKSEQESEPGTRRGQRRFAPRPAYCSGPCGQRGAAGDDAQGRVLCPRVAHAALLREEVAQLQEEVHLLRQMKEMLTKDLEETHGSKSPEVLSATELKVQLAQKEQELARAKEALQAMKADRKRLKAEKTDLVSQMQQLYATLESREEQLRDFIRNYEQHRKESEDAVKALAKEKDLLEREKWELRRQAKEATDHASALRSQLDLKDNRMKELEAELAMAKQSLATLTKDVPKRHSLAMPGETVLNGNQEWVMQADLPLTAAIRQSQQTLYHSHPQHPADRQAVRVSPCHSRQPSIISDASAAEGDRSSTPSDINSPRHRTHSLCNGDSPGPVQKNLHNPIVQSLEDLEDQKRKKKKEKMGFGSISRVFARGKQRKSLDPGLFDGTAPDYYIEEDADW
uniref:Kazrin, periplakin interacting protein n=2 Tax=Falco TaxID=8952 RepID=A0A8C4V4H1_FALTI